MQITAISGQFYHIQSHTIINKYTNVQEIYTIYINYKYKLSFSLNKCPGTLGTQALLSHSPHISQIRIPSVLSVCIQPQTGVGLRQTINYCAWCPMLIGGPTEAGCRAINLPSHLTVVPEGAGPKG